MIIDGFEVQIRLPRVKCICDGSVRLDFGGLLRPYQRLDDRVDAQIKRWAKLRISLREMQEELGRMRIGSLGLRPLNIRLHQLATANPHTQEMPVLPILQIDAIWVTLVLPNGKMQADRRGRLRPDKDRSKRPILVAMGVWPDTDRREILAWQLASSEDGDAWLAFLSQLEAAGIRGDQGLQARIHGHDGGCRRHSPRSTQRKGENSASSVSPR